MIVHSDILGPLEVAEEQLLRFPAGLLGLPECRSFVMLPAEREGFFWLQSTEQSELAFVLLDPFLFFDDYVVDLSPADMRELGIEQPADVMILAIVTLSRTREKPPTANLQGPLALNVDAGIAKQIAVSESDYGVRCPFDLPD
jgi:flagellar assembly factor FliW